jgi:hypothetical protein
MRKSSIKRLITLALLAAWSSPASAGIPSKEAVRHIGQTVTVSGRATLAVMPSGEVYIDLDGQGENAPFAGYVSRWNRINFQNLWALNGRNVQITGRIATFRDQPQIFLRDASQVRVK